MRVRRETQPVAIAMISFLCLLAAGIFAGCSDSSSGAASQTTRSIVVADMNNNRIVLYNLPISTNQSANAVLGQPDFTANEAHLQATGMTAPWATAEDSAGNLYVADYGNNRILQFRPPFASGMAASLVLGQSDFGNGLGTVTQNGLFGPAGLTFDKSGNLWVADRISCRVLEFEPPFSTDMNASLVLGQTNFTSELCKNGSAGFYGPTQLVFDSGGNLWVSDFGNNRVLEFKPPFSNGMDASLVIGQN